MKNIFTVAVLAVFLAGCSSESEVAEVTEVTTVTKDNEVTTVIKVTKGNENVVDYKRIQKRNGIFYEVNNEEPFTGKAVQYYKNRQKVTEAQFKDGKYHGKSTNWYENGQKMAEINYENGKKNGLVTLWYENGQKKMTFKDGKKVSETKWDKNGNVIK